MNQDMPNDLSGVPTPKPTPAPSSLPPPSSGPSSQATSSFDFNQPTIISALYLSGFVLGVTWIVGVVLA